MSRDEIDEILDRDKQFEMMQTDTESQATIFRQAPLRRFIIEALAQVNPTLSVTAVTLQNYEGIFHKFILPRVCFAFWDVRNDQETYENWPEALKMDEFLYNAWHENYEDDIKAKFIYDV